MAVGVRKPQEDGLPRPAFHLTLWDSNFLMELKRPLITIPAFGILLRFGKAVF